MYKPKEIFELLWSMATAPLSPKNLRISAILIAIYQLLIAHIVLFIALLGLAHAEQMKTMLEIDIADQKEYEFYELSNSKNQIRLKTASDLVCVTEIILYIGTVIASVYLLSCLALFVGVFKNRSELLLPWLIVDMIGIILVLIIMIWTQNHNFIYLIGGRTQYWLLCVGFTVFDVMIWYVIHAYYLSLRQIKKLTEIATVAIPCPAPGTIPFYFRKENMHLGNGGYKHILSDGDPNEKI